MFQSSCAMAYWPCSRVEANIVTSFYVYGSVHRWSILIIVQRHATQSSLFIILQVHSKCFGCQPHPSFRSTQNCNYSLRYWSYFFVQLPPSNVAKLASTPDAGCGWHPKHLEWTCRIINILLSVVSRWTIINTVTYITEQWHSGRFCHRRKYRAVFCDPNLKRQRHQNLWWNTPSIRQH